MTDPSPGPAPPPEDAAWDAAWPASGRHLRGTGTLRRRPVNGTDHGLLLGWFAGAHPELAAVPLPPVERDRLLRQQAQGRQDQYRGDFPHAGHWVLELDGRPAGHLMVDLDGERCLIVVLEIDPALRGQGVGSSALAAAMAVADAHGVPTRLHVQPGNPARRLYERLGFDVVDGPDATPLDLLMERPCPTSPT